MDDEKEWLMWEKLGDEVLHIELRRWADAFVIAPLSANTLAKLANGLCDNALTCTARAWDPSEAPLIAAPAMNTVMWEHPLTSQQIVRRALHSCSGITIPVILFLLTFPLYDRTRWRYLAFEQFHQPPKSSLVVTWEQVPWPLQTPLLKPLRLSLWLAVERNERQLTRSRLPAALVVR